MEVHLNEKSSFASVCVGTKPQSLDSTPSTQPKKQDYISLLCSSILLYVFLDGRKRGAIEGNSETDTYLEQTKMYALVNLVRIQQKKCLHLYWYIVKRIISIKNIASQSAIYSTYKFYSKIFL
jgi:hypothetical protein